MKQLKQSGITHIVLLLILLGVVVVGGTSYRVITLASNQHKPAAVSKTVTPKTPKPATSTQKASPITQPQPPTTTTPSTSARRTTTPPAPVSFSTPIQIRGDAACQSTTLDALKLLSNNAPSHYATVTSYISIIDCEPSGSGMYAYESPPRYVVGDATRNAGTVWYASTIAHDAGHSKLYHDYLAAHPGQAVPNDVWTGQSAEVTCLDAQYDALTKIGGTQAQLDYVQNVINTQYYNVPPDQRWW